MSIKYKVVHNALQPGQYYPRTVKSNTRDLEELIKLVGQTSTVSESDLRAVLAGFIQQINNALVAGDRVSIDGLADFSVRLSQPLESVDERFDFDRGGELLLAATAKPQLTATIRHAARFEKVLEGDKTPLLAGFRDAATKSRNQYTPGSVGRLSGKNLRLFPPEDAEVGVFFVAESDGSASQVTVIENNGDRRLIFEIPEGLTGDHRVQVRTRYAIDGELRSGTLSTTLTQA